VVEGEVGRGRGDVGRAGGRAVAGMAAGVRFPGKNAVQSLRLGGMVLSCSPLLQVQGEGRHCHSCVPNLS
jgi:hypothetical protein